ncbi:MAG: hypothetical protein DCC74_01165 [Proteobacteria bacterium]|mgnify:CR=1 FL=1|nr:MAG: hypothetical protein DCC74_01165 [Pseudomonadota bacterium]
MTAARLSPLYLAAALSAAVALAGPAAASEGTITSAAATAATQNVAASVPAPRAAPARAARARTASHAAERGIASPVLTSVRYAGAPSGACTGLWCGRLVMLMLGIGF